MVVRRRFGSEGAGRVGDQRLTVHVWNELPEIPKLAETVDAFCAERGLPEMLAFQINLALDELLTNTISYGYPDRERHAIEVDLLCRDGSLWIEIIDDGRPFDPLGAPAPDLDAPVEQRRVGGLGVHLVKTVMDAVEYQRKSDRNHLKLRKDIPGAAAEG
jgi:anti-sigma regulatory factor (Ser/Thr protein kinase)